MVNRGWIPRDLHNLGFDRELVETRTVRGVLYRGDPVTRESKKNIPTGHKFWSVRPEEMQIFMNFGNE